MNKINQLKAAVLLLLVMGGITIAAQDSIPTLTEKEREQIEQAGQISDLFKTESETRLELNADCPIGVITDKAIDSNGNMIIADGWQARAVYIFNPEGTFVRQLGRNGEGPGEYQTPVSLDIDRGGLIWIGDFLGNRMLVFNQNFEFQRILICKPRIHHYVRIDGKGNLYSYSGGRPPQEGFEIFDTIHKFDPKGNRLYVTDWNEAEETEENPTIVCLSLYY